MEITVETIRRFPTLARSFDKSPEPPRDFVGWLRAQTAANDDHGLAIGLARRYAAKLLLHLSGADPSFNLGGALEIWDEEHRAAAEATIFGAPAEEGPPSSDFAAGCLTVP